MTTILIIIVVLLLFRWGIRYILPYILAHQLKKFQQRFYQQNPQAHQEAQAKPGSVTVEEIQQNEAKLKDAGEYVDYEEIK